MKKENLSLEELMRIAKASDTNKPEDMISAVENRVPDDKMREIKRILGDKKALEDLLKSEQAQRLIRQFRNGK